MEVIGVCKGVGEIIGVFRSVRDSLGLLRKLLGFVRV